MKKKEFIDIQNKAKKLYGLNGLPVSISDELLNDYVGLISEWNKNTKNFSDKGKKLSL